MLDQPSALIDIRGVCRSFPKGSGTRDTRPTSQPVPAAMRRINWPRRHQS